VQQEHTRFLPANAIDLASRIAFKTASKTDSRTIPDARGVSGLLRAQGALVSDEEINRIVEDAEYPMNIHALVEKGEDADTELDNENWEDDMILAAAMTGPPYLFSSED
jgi:DNA segregation ATPase FtsK/SpoIIIE-like protein